MNTTLAEWQKRRQEEAVRRASRDEATRRAVVRDEDGKKKTPGQIAYEKKMQQKRLLGESQALLNKKAKPKAAQSAKPAIVEDTFLKKTYASILKSHIHCFHSRSSL